MDVKSAAERQPCLDHLRAAITALVVFHHAAITYGAPGGWYWHERHPGFHPGLTLFVMANQAWFMGLFFLIAGHFTPAAFDRKGTGRFVRERLLRLGVPLLVFAVLLDPLTNALAGHDLTFGAVMAGWARRLAHRDFHPGPLWFAEALLLFTAAYAAWRRAGKDAGVQPFPGPLALLAAAASLAVVAFVVRLVFPTDRDVAGLLPGYFPGYVLLFAAGIAGARGDWPAHVPGRAACLWLLASAAALAGLVLSVRLPGPPRYAGGWALKAAVAAVWEPFFAWGVILALLYSVHRWLNRPWAVPSWCARRAFAVYVIHAPVLVLIARFAEPWDASAATKTLVVGSAACLACLVAADGLLRLPGVTRVL